jgi:O-antigen/teichoic acid export membrane protein
VWLARVLGTETFGVLEFANSLLAWFLLLADGGLELWATREVARTSDVRALVARVVPLRFLLATASFVLLFLCLPALPGPLALKLVAALFGLSLFAQAATLKWVFLGREQMPRVATGLILTQVIFGVAILAAIRRPEQVYWVPLLRFAGDGAAAIYFAHQFRKDHGRLSLPFTFTGARLAIGPALTMGLTQAMGLLNFNLDSLLLGFLRGLREVGLYNAAYKPVTVALQVPLTFFVGLFPALARSLGQSRVEFARLMDRSYRLCAIVALPLGVAGSVLAADIIQFLFAAPYGDSAEPFAVLIWSAVLVILRGSHRHALNAGGHQALDLRCALASGVVNVGLNLALIPRYGMLGSAAATVIGDAVWLALTMHFFHRHVMPMNPLPVLVRPALAAAAMGGFLWWMGFLPWMVRGAAGAAVYVALLLILGEPEVRRWLRFGRPA